MACLAFKGVVEIEVRDLLQASSMFIARARDDMPGSGMPEYEHSVLYYMLRGTC